MEYKNVYEANKHKKGEEIMETLSQNVQQEFKKEFFGKILSNYKLFNLNFSQEARDQFCMYMKELNLQPGDCLFSQNSYNDNIYFLYNGEVHIIQDINNERRIIGTAKTGDVLGNHSFFTFYQEDVGAISSGTSQLVYCNRNDFLTVLKQYPKDYVSYRIQDLIGIYCVVELNTQVMQPNKTNFFHLLKTLKESFCRLRDNIKVYNRYYEQKCFGCSQIGHPILKCPFYDKRREPYLTIFRFNRNITQPRKSQKRNCDKKFNTLSKNKNVRKVLREIRWFYANEVQADLQEIESEDEEEIMNSSDFQFFLSVPQFRYVDDQFLLTDEDENDIGSEHFREYNVEQVDDHSLIREPSIKCKDNTETQTAKRVNITGAQTADKSGVGEKQANQYTIQEVVVECDNESSGSETKSRKETASLFAPKKKKHKEEIRNRNQSFNAALEKHDDDHNSLNQHQLSLQDLNHFKIKQKETSEAKNPSHKVNSIDLLNKKGFTFSQRTNSGNISTSSSQNYNQGLSINTVKQNSGDLLTQQISDNLEEVNMSNNNLQLFDSSQQLNSSKPPNSSVTIQSSHARKHSFQASILQQKYNQAQQKRESKDTNSIMSRGDQGLKLRRSDHSHNPELNLEGIEQELLKFHLLKLNEEAEKHQLQYDLEMKQKANQFMIIELDRQKDWKAYYPNNNLPNVLRLYTKYLQKIKQRDERLKKGPKNIRFRKNAHKLTLANILQKKDPKLKSLFASPQL